MVIVKPKTVIKREKPQIYIPQDFKLTMRIFHKLILDDDQVKALVLKNPRAVHNTNALSSLVIRGLIAAYVNANKHKLKNETASN